jgi:mono/diheme cytochrome c family protein
MALIHNAPRNAIVRTRTKSTVAVLGKQNFATMLNLIPSAQGDIMKTVNERAMSQTVNGPTEAIKGDLQMTRLAMITAAAMLMAASSAWAADATAGKAAFDSKCRTCHAADGAGNPGIAKALGVTLKPLGGEEVQKMSDADLKKVLTAGSGKMKPVAGLTPAQTDDVVAFVRTLKK